MLLRVVKFIVIVENCQGLGREWTGELVFKGALILQDESSGDWLHTPKIELYF